MDAATRAAVGREWRRIERWLRARAPKTYAALSTPGRSKTIAVAEAQMGLDFPDDLRASLLRHNGDGGSVVLGGQGLSVRGIRDTWRALCATGPHPEWNGRMIPFQRRGAGWGVADSAQGTVSWDDGIAGFATQAPGHLALLRRVAAALETGGAGDEWKPSVKRGTLHWQLDY
ncbi:hypothetical protein OIE66_27645 [Nonomuraea sp. NBC_01738]|uniref:SMI1/KNR4 family protein n=1 Tax=Nonomuraea sp. NBC_01738 TaxID=2976003 RepID=UPI002E103345|nr:hypothetical protein OIE66_27645 [Nonomuraea sp. NBC_01738]